MSNICIITKKKLIIGNKISHSNKKNKKKFLVNFKKYKLKIKNKIKKIKISVKAIKLIKKNIIKNEKKKK
ncbi:50S ribosomal subunit protein L28 [Candidatus Zinderia insecticola CARI]|uniref:Large ribosomal subunit protein bL28 n=1 Tax=Zinderia insecticola (strain CARI) TaxID=871271 RepID=E0TJ53_ZINIC|nr:50S ribosomal subunit protein L28 [Candidatus Zinderia insecticola CARI]